METVTHIPWNLLTSHLQYAFANTDDKQGATDLFPQFEEGQGHDVNAFVKKFAQIIEERSKVERKKYPDRYDPPDMDTILLDDDLVKRISPALYRLRLHKWIDGETHKGDVFYNSKLCSHEENDGMCTCPVRYEERKASSFLRQKKDNGCFDFYEINNLGYLNMEVVKTLLVSGDMEPILRACAHPDNDLQTWWSLASCECGAEFPSLGWDHVYERALDAYICLNVLYCFPMIQDHHSDEQDYRRTRCYQKLIRENGILGTEAIRLLHLEFFGIGANQFSAYPRAREGGQFEHLGEGLRGRDLERSYPYGLMHIQDFLEFETVASHLPTESEVIHVTWMLGEKGLPVEISSSIMELADYEPRRRLKVPHDPFHRDNKAELERYLSCCWNVLIRCDILGKALGEPIDWDACLTKCLVLTLGLETMEDEAEYDL